jgi:effector-binding domain-containing protein
MGTHLSTGPTIVTRAEQPYVAVRRAVTMQTMNEIADRLPEVFGWLGARGIQPAGAPFLKYNVIDMAGRLEVEAGVPVAAVPAVDDSVIAGVLPAGRYVTAGHVGHPARLIDATAELLAWASAQGLEWDAVETPEGDRWGCRLELYHTDPAVEPDMNTWATELAIRLAG